MKAALRKHILLAEDEPGVREAIKLLLSVDEHKVTEAANGSEALDCFTRHRFDLVITDYEMPKMKGSELAVEIKRRSPSQPVIMITAYPEKVANAENPVDAILSKPFTFQDLRRAIANLLS